MAPTYAVGDFWTIEGEQSIGRQKGKYTATMAVVGEEVLDGTDCWILEIEDPSSGMTVPQRAWVKKSEPLLSMVKMIAEGGGDKPFMMLTEFSLELPDGPPWPFEVGKKFAARISTRQVSVAGKVEGEAVADFLHAVEFTPGPLETYKVEKREEIKVPAGKFDCFKIVVYNEQGKSYRTLWYSDKAKHTIKEIRIVKSPSFQGQSVTVRMEGKLKDYSLA